MEVGMDKSTEFRKNAEKCSEIAQSANTDPKKKQFERLAQGWSTLAENQAWLDGDQQYDQPHKS
jgi:hypothetical protein